MEEPGRFDDTIFRRHKIELPDSIQGRFIGRGNGAGKLAISTLSIIPLKITYPGRVDVVPAIGDTGECLKKMYFLRITNRVGRMHASLQLVT